MTPIWTGGARWCDQCGMPMVEGDHPLYDACDCGGNYHIEDAHEADALLRGAAVRNRIETQRP